MPLNQNNFLRWEGNFRPKDFTISGFGSHPTLFADEDSCSYNPLGVCSASNGIDYTSFKIVDISAVLSSPPEWNSDTQIFKTYRPTDATLTFYILHFTFADVLGNISPLIQILVAISPIYTTWIAYPASVVCLLDGFGNNTGYKSWAELVLVNMSTSTPIVPLTLKPNSVGDIDYIAPVQDYSLCPPSGAGTGNYAPLTINNASQNGGDPSNFITIKSIYLSSSTMGPGATPLTINIPCNIPPGITARFNIPATGVGFTYDGGISLTYTVSGNMVTAPVPRYWKQTNAGVTTGFGNGGTGLMDNLVDNSGIITKSAFSIPYPSGLVIFPQ